MRAQILWRETAMEGEVDFELGQSFRILDSLEASLLRWQDYVQLYKRNSRSVVAARKHCTKRQSETLTILCVFSGRSQWTF